MFLHNNPQYNTAADIVKVRKSTKSHVSTSLKDLEGKGMVERIHRCMSEENQGVKKMKEEDFKPQMPDIMEVIFDVGYLIFDLIAAIIISFGCYTPVTLFSKTKPKVRLLMILKTCAYMWIIAMGLQLLF